ncbi:unnamed protein product [Phytomonas sp. Hart1]|nr:unnamed protein product [Phytomonas sp. Hart1]|eukprot:CCW66540.1 unnamed protein product [Phytomonas sp. isolate Hart1]
MEHALAWDLDKEVVLVQLHHLILALRSGLKFRSKGRYESIHKAHDHPLLCSAMKLRKQLLSCTQTGCSDWAPVDHHLGIRNAIYGDPKNVEVAGNDSLHLPQTEAIELFSTVPTSVSRSSLSQIQKLSESEILSPFCEVCRCPDIGEPIIIVALSAIDTILDFCHSMISVKGVKLAIETALSLRSVVSDPDTHEVLLARTLQLCITGIRLEAAIELPEDVYIQVVRRGLVISLRPEATPLLKRVAEGCMTFLVTCLYSRVVHRQGAGNLDPLGSPTPPHPSLAQGLTTSGGEPSSLKSKSLSIHNSSDTSTLSTPTSLDGASMMRYISSIISTDVTTLDAEGNILSDEDSSQRSESTRFSVVADRNSPTIQLEGLSLAQAALLTIQDHLSDSCSVALLSVVQNNISRALLVTAMRTPHFVVLALVLRLIYILVKNASHCLVPQIFNFLRFIYLNPIITSTRRINRINSSQTTNIRSYLTSSTRSTATLLPLNSKGHQSFSTDGLFDDIPYSQSNGALECREIFLESLAELCSNPFFCNFCFLHYDLSWRCHSLLPQLCNVLVESACPGILGTNDNAFSSFTSDDCGVSVQHTQNNQKTDVNDGDAEDRKSVILPISRIELVALDAARDMVSNFALRLSKGRYPIPQSTPDDGSNTAYEWKVIVEHMYTQKDLLLKFAALIEDSPLKKGIPFLLENSIRAKAIDGKQASKSHSSWLMLVEPAGGYEIGQCLYRLSHLLNKRVLGNYIGELGTERLPKPPEDEVVMLSDGTVTTAVEVWEKNRSEDHLFPGTVRFFQQQLEGFVGEFVFVNKPLLTSIRELVYHLCLPGESQKIDRVIEVFSKQWYLHNKNSEKLINPFSSESGAFVLSFAIIMLNTDLHSGKMQKCMTQNDFKNINRSIDNGDSLPDEYLFNIYNDVKRDELVMAEMVNRGFANNVTWDLEISRFSSEGEDNFALSYFSNLFRLSGSQGINPCSMTTSSALPMGYSLYSERMLSELDPYVFNVIQNRCFQIFKHLLGNLCTQVMRLNPRGSTLKDALDDAHAILPQETSALFSSIQGIRMLALSATALGQHEVSDECVMTLTSYVHVSFSEGMDAVDDLHRNLPKLLLIKEILSLLQSTALSLRNSWSVIGDLLLNLYLLGMLAVQIRPNGDVASFSRDEITYASFLCLNETVFRPPDLATLYSIDYIQNPAQTKKIVGWLSAFWGSAFNYKENDGRQREDTNSGSILGTQLETRVRECIPDMQEILCMMGSLSLTARAELLRAFMNADCSSTFSVHSHSVKPNSLAFSCHKLSFVTACVAATTLYLDEQEVFHSYLNYLQDTFSTQFKAYVSCDLRNSHTNDENAFTGQLSNGMKTNVTTLWIGSKLISKTIATVLDILKSLFIPKHDFETSATIMHNILKVLLSVPKPAFNDFVVLPLVNFLSSWIMSVGAVREKAIMDQEDGRTNSFVFFSFQFSQAFPVVQFLVDSVTKLDILTLDPTVLPKIETILLYLVKNAMYNLESEMSLLLKLVLSLEILHKKQKQGHKSQGLSSVDLPFSHGGEKNLTELQQSASQSASSEEIIFAEILGYCSSNIVRLRKGLTSFCPNTHHLAKAGLRETIADSITPLQTDINWKQLWILSLQSLSSLILSSSQGSRARGGAMLALRHAVLDMEPGTLDAAAIESAYNMVLFPLTETICATPSTLAPTTAFPPQLCTSDPLHVSGMLNSSDTWVASLQQLVLPPLSIEVKPASAEDKSCIINILSKVFLHHMSILENSPEMLRTLWQSILSTFYIVYTTPLAQGNTLNERDDVGLSRIKGANTEYFMEEASLLRMALEETVKNMVYVVASSKGNVHSSTLSAQESSFPTFTRHLISPFPFSKPLLEFLDSIEVPVQIEI